MSFFRAQNLIAPALSRPVGSGTHPRLALSRMQMLEQLVLSQGISTDKQSGLTCRVLSECGCSGIHHATELVRKVAERILLLVYKVNPRIVRKQLPPDDDITRRNLLYRQLFAEFDKIDSVRRREMLEANPRNFPIGILRNSVTMTPSTSSVTNSSTSHSESIHSESTSCRLNNGTNPNSADSTTLNSPRKSINYSDSPRRTSAEANGEYELKESTSNSHSNSIESDGDKCPFCEWSYNGEADQLDKHYWKACPVLMKCPQCSQVLEVAALCSHLLG